MDLQNTTTNYNTKIIVMMVMTIMIMIVFQRHLYTKVSIGDTQVTQHEDQVKTRDNQSGTNSGGKP